MADPTLWLKQIHVEDRAYVLKELAHIHAGAAPRPCEYRMLTCEGRIVWFRDDSAVLRDRNGQPLLLYGVMLDITDHKRLEAELIQAQRRLIENIKEKFSPARCSSARALEDETATTPEDE